MRTCRHHILGALSGGALAFAGCRAIDDLGSLRFDLSQGGGGSAGGSSQGGGASCGLAGDVCAPPQPLGWLGPVAVYETTSGTMPGCSGEYSILRAQGHAGLQAPPAACQACSCSAPVVGCGPSTLDSYWKSNCHGGSGQPAMLSSGSCTMVGGSNAYFQQTSPKPTVSPCTPSGGAATLPPPTWTTTGIACGLAGQTTTCADESVCAPAPPSPFEATWCILQMGVHACPLGFPRQHVWEDVAADGRGCTPCTCDDPSGASCATTTTLYGDAQCNGQVATIMTDDACVSAPNALAALATTTPSGSPSCPAGGGSPMGSATTVPVLTLCCRQ